MSRNHSEIVPKFNEKVNLGSYIFDPFKSELHNQNGEIVPLRVQSIEVLSVLAKHLNEIVSKDTLVETVWSDNIVTDDSLVQCISDIRKSINDTDHKIIQTFAKQGYRLNADIAAKTTSYMSHIPVGGGLIAACFVLICVLGLAVLMFQHSDKDTVAPLTTKIGVALPDKPSIAVLPFTNLSGDPKQDYLGEGISENIITALSKNPDMFVIARTSTFTYKNKLVKVQQVAKELGVRYVLEGSVQQFGDQVRVTTQLIDALSGHHLWAESYDHELKNAFFLQDEITLNVLKALHVNLGEGSLGNISRATTKNLEAYQLVRSGIRLFRRYTKTGNTEARRLFSEAVKLDPKYAFGWYFVGMTHLISSRRGFVEDTAREQARAEELAHKAMEIDPSFGHPYHLLALISLHERRYDEAISYNQKAAALEPNSAIIVGVLGRNMVYVGRPEEGLSLIQRGIRLSPIASPTILRFEGIAYYSMGRYEEAIAAFKRARARNPKSPQLLAWLAITFADMGRSEEARAAAQEVLKFSLSFPAKGFVNTLFYKDRTKPLHVLATLQQLGLAK